MHRRHGTTKLFGFRTKIVRATPLNQVALDRKKRIEIQRDKLVIPGFPFSWRDMTSSEANVGGLTDANNLYCNCFAITYNGRVNLVLIRGQPELEIASKRLAKHGIWFLENAMNSVELAATNAEMMNAPAASASWRDWTGIAASIGCAIHCAAMPFVFAYLPALGLSFLADESFHKWMALICFLIAIVAFIPGIRKHGNWIPVSVGAIGLAFITFAAFGLAGECCQSCAAAESNGTHATLLNVSGTGADTECETCECHSCAENSEGTLTSTNPHPEKGLLSTLAPWITPLGGMMLVSAHLLNRRFGCLCGCCKPSLNE